MKSAALQWAALCVCPPAILATSVATVPSVKRAVHHATRVAPAKHKVAQPRKPVQTAAARGVPCDIAPAILAPALLAYADDLAAVGGGLDDPGSLSPDNGTGVTTVPGTPVRFGIGPDPLAMPVPEPQAWLMMIAGFGLVGMGLRWRRARGATASGPVVGNTFRRRRRSRAAGGASTLMASLGFGEVATGSASMATIAAKTMMCVCPTVAMVGATMAVPPLRNAVHTATRTAQVKSAMVMPEKPPCDPALRSAEATPPSRIIDGVEASPKVATALLASTSTGGTD